MPNFQCFTSFWLYCQNHINHAITHPLLWLLLLMMLAPLCSFAATPAEIAAQRSEQFLRNEQQRLWLEQRERMLRELERSMIYVVPIVPEAPQSRYSSTTCFKITEIQLLGVDNLLIEEQQALIKPFLNRCLNLSQIDELRTAIDKHYIEKGFVMARAYLTPNQNLSAGILIFQILEGTLDGVLINDSKEDAGQSATAFPDMVDEIIQLRDIEQGLEQMNRLASNSATMSIRPVQNKPGYSEILINNKVSGAYRATLGIDNQGSESNGTERGKLTLEADNLFGVNDSWSLQGTDYIGDERDNRESTSYNLNASFVYGYWNYDFTNSHSEYLSTVDNGGSPFTLSGGSDSYTLKASRSISRTKVAKTNVSASLAVKDNESFLQDVKLETSSRRLSIFDLGLSHVVREPGTLWSYQLTYSRGIDLFDALDDGPVSDKNIPKAQFEKIQWDISTQFPASYVGEAWTYKGNWSGQVSRNPLFGSEQFTIGSLGSVRGFKESSVSGDSGLYFKNDLQQTVSSENSFLNNLRWSLGFDLGYVAAKNENINGSGESGASLAGLAFVASDSYAWADSQQIYWSLTLAVPVYAPDYLDEDSSVTYFDLSWRFW